LSRRLLTPFLRLGVRDRSPSTVSYADSKIIRGFCRTSSSRREEISPQDLLRSCSSPRLRFWSSGQIITVFDFFTAIDTPSIALPLLVLHNK